MDFYNISRTQVISRLSHSPLNARTCVLKVSYHSVTTAYWQGPYNKICRQNMYSAYSDYSYFRKDAQKVINTILNHKKNALLIW